MKKIKSILEKVGLKEIYNPNDFLPKEIKLRDGRDAILWVNQIDNHGILDDDYWEDENYYKKNYRVEFSSVLNSHTKSEEHLEIYKKINEKQYHQFSEKINSQTCFLEIGSSFGGIANHINKLKLQNKDFIEPNEDDYYFCKNKFEECNFINSNFESFNFEKKQYDLIVSFEVLEHIFNLSTFIQKVNSILKIGGAVNFEVPNHNDALLVNYQNLGYKNFYYHKAHIHYFSPSSLKTIFNFFGIEGKVYGYQMYPLFNQVNWLYNNVPQKTAIEALNIPKLDNRLEKNIFINNFFEKIQNEYYTLVEENLISDCLIFKGKKI